MVGSTLSGSVVAKTKTRNSGGSSTSFSRALKPCVVTMCASSTMYTLKRLLTGAKKARSRRSRASSTPPWLAASISITSSEPGPSGASATHEPHTPHGVDVGPCSQLSERARIRADDVLPQPRGEVTWRGRRPGSTGTSSVSPGEREEELDLPAVLDPDEAQVRRGDPEV